jgi:superfamily II DNA or RNA helicase
MLKLRPWQIECKTKALNWFSTGNRTFLMDVAPGGGKTKAACMIAKELLETGEIDCVVVVAPRRSVVRQWAEDFQTICGRTMLQITGNDEDLSAYGGVDFAITWSALSGASPAIYQICKSKNVVWISDDHHHAGLGAAWGDGADNAFSKAKHTMVLTGTPIRSDGSEAVSIAYDGRGKIDHPEAGTYTLSYGAAVDLDYCRPITFHRHEGNFTVVFDSGDTTQVSGLAEAPVDDRMRRVPALRRALEFYKLACTPIFDEDGQPCIRSYQATMLEWGIQKLDDLRLSMPDSGGLIIANNIEMADYMANLLEILEGERPFVVHNQIANSDAKIQAFKSNSSRWLVSVGMVSEGVDIPRLRVLVYLPFARTELAFRQAMGRVVRNNGPDDGTRAYVIMPAHRILEEYARCVELEMGPKHSAEPDAPRTKVCPVCSTQCHISASACHECDDEFPLRHSRQKACDDCGSPNPFGANECIACGCNFTQGFSVRLNEALRYGAIVRGMEVDEEEVVLGETLAPELQKKILRSGDEFLVNLLRTVPEESYGRLARMMGKIN